MDDRAQIEQLIYEYTHLLDDGDFEGFGRLFEDGEWSLDGENGFNLRGATEIADWLRQNLHTYENGILRTSHATTNVIIHIEGDSASARSYLTVFQAVPPQLPLQPIFSGRYRDTFVKRNGKWSFENRAIETLALGDMSAHVKGV